jgi:acetylornithine deacetylase
MSVTPDPEAAVLDGIDGDAIARDLAAVVRIPSLTGAERAAIEVVAQLASDAGLAVEVHEHDLAALRGLPGHPGEEAPRSELVGLSATLAGADPGGAGRLALNGHLDVVHPGTEPWTHPPFDGAAVDGFLYGRGSADMKGGVVAALHALAAIKRAGIVLPHDVVLQGVSSEEDGGLGTFAALERDQAFSAALIPEPTGFELICAQAGAATFEGVVRGRSAHAAMRLEGVSAIDRYLPVHQALHEHERRVNANVDHPLMRVLELPYPLLVGRIAAGQWSSQVPDELRFEGRLGVRVNETLAHARAALERAVLAATDDDDPPVELTWTGGQYAPGETATDHPFVGLVQEAAAAELGTPPVVAGVPYGADMRLFCERGIPCVMLGPGGIERAHGVDERVALDEVVALARIIARIALRFSP